MPKKEECQFSERDLDALAAPQKVLDRFFGKVTKTSGCHYFATADAQGRGDFTVVGKLSMSASRFALLHAHKKCPPKGMYSCHKCLVKNCVNPDHLYWGTPKQNCADKKRDGTENPVHSLDHFRAKLTPARARKIVLQYMDDKKSIACIATQNGVSVGSVANIIKGKTWARHTAGIVIIPRPDKSKHVPRGGKHHHALISDKEAAKIIKMLENGKSIQETANHVGVLYSCVKDIKNVKTWKHLPRSVALPRKKYTPETLIRRGVARQVFRDYHIKGKSVSEIATQRDLRWHDVQRICIRKKNADDTFDIATDSGSGHLNRKGNKKPRPRTCVICLSAFFHGRVSKKTCSHECLCIFRKNLVTRTHAQGKIKAAMGRRRPPTRSYV